jgi:hypothetical protein
MSDEAAQFKMLEVMSITNGGSNWRLALSGTTKSSSFLVRELVNSGNSL